MRIGGSKIQGTGEVHQIAQINGSTVTAPGVWLAKSCWLGGLRLSPLIRTAPFGVGALVCAARN
jgi:hypothetical protein